MKHDIAIIGGGLAGLTMACRLGMAGVDAVCIDAGAVQAQNTDLRTTAISYGSQKILAEAGIWDNLPAAPCPIDNIEIFDGNSSLLLNFLIGEVANKTSAKEDGDAFGWIVLNSDLHAAMLKTLKSFKSVTHLSSTKVRGFNIDENAPSAKIETDHTSHPEITATLIIGADGRGSFTRGWMEEHTGLRTRSWSYKQRAVICTVSHENPHNNIAVEHFWPAGPLAILPMVDGPKGAHRSSVVFTEHGPGAQSLMHLSDNAFETALAAKFPARYGDIKLMNERVSYPLNLVHAANYIAPRMVLVADAAHGIHPIAGQGLNLGFRDVKALADLIVEAHEANTDTGAQDLLKRYQRARRPDNMSMVAVTDGLNRLFSNNIPPVRLLRRIGLRAVSKIGPAKKFFMTRAMGHK